MPARFRWSLALAGRTGLTFRPGGEYSKLRNSPRHPLDATRSEDGHTLIRILVIGALLGLLPASIAKSKGYGFGTWWLYGSALFIVALPHALIMKLNQAGIEARQLDEGMKKCPSCAEMVRGEAAKCRFCGYEWVPIVASWTIIEEEEEDDPSKGRTDLR